MSMASDHPDGYVSDTAHRVIGEHVTGPCLQCQHRRCRLLEWAVKTVVTSLQPDQQVPLDQRHPLTLAARRVAEVHWPGGDGRCTPCRRADCEPGGLALTWLNAINDPWSPTLASAPSVVTLRQITGMD
ncbi:hypothetical protein [Plantactinospora soyae]|uniref:Uncharacterized protein n=1 Tax=Plantactinospora soyae TaxID=1544732 RepID=A0A927QVL3_9ACTN|nr:hypothetical protein [Plantactinospora soyae]MBE1485865.1 hypothetical protein [Plantactinospora soyae]